MNASPAHLSVRNAKVQPPPALIAIQMETLSKKVPRTNAFLATIS